LSEDRLTHTHFVVAVSSADAARARAVIETLPVSRDDGGDPRQPELG
jgi:hypothetical protein